MKETFMKIANAIKDAIGEDKKYIIAARGSRCMKRPIYIKEPTQSSDWDIAICIDTTDYVPFMDSEFSKTIAAIAGVDRVDIQFSKPQYDPQKGHYVVVPYDYFWKENILIINNWDRCQSNTNKKDA